MAIASRLVPAVVPCVGRRWISAFQPGLFTLCPIGSSVVCAGQSIAGGFKYPKIRSCHVKALLPREIQLWYILPDEVSSSHLLNQYLDLLSPSERESILSMNDRKLQKGALLARVLVRTALSRCIGDNISPSLLKFRKNIFGKPELDWENGEDRSTPYLQFNLSHTPSLIACGVSTNMRIGIDVEQKDRQLRNDILSFAKRYFTPIEVAYLHQFSDSDIQRQELIKMWTLKEAYVKALGRGFSAAPFRDFLIRFKPHMDAQSCDETTGVMKTFTIEVESCVDADYLTTNWQFLLLELGRSHYIAICVEEDADEWEKPVLKIQKTIPLIKDEAISGTEVVTICGLS